MDGDISFTSRLGKGSEFTFKAELGLYKPLGVEETKKIFGDRHPRPRVNGKTVLVAEDQPLMRKLVKRTLDGYGVNALMAEDGLQAVEIVKSKAASIDLIIMDLDMPNLNGLDATKEIRDMGHDMGIVCFSANPSDKIKKKCLEVGFSDFIPKLISPQSFNRILKPLEDIPSET
jgi:CheY-like chemotaxis protein